MEVDHLGKLTILAEVTTAFVVFAAIVASPRVSLDKKPSPFQRFLIDFFADRGMLTVSVELLPLELSA